MENIFKELSSTLTSAVIWNIKPQIIKEHSLKVLLEALLFLDMPLAMMVRSTFFDLHLACKLGSLLWGEDLGDPGFKHPQVGILQLTLLRLDTIASRKAKPVEHIAVCLTGRNTYCKHITSVLYQFHRLPPFALV